MQGYLQLLFDLREQCFRRKILPIRKRRRWCVRVVLPGASTPTPSARAPAPAGRWAGAHGGRLARAEQAVEEVRYS